MIQAKVMVTMLGVSEEQTLASAETCLIQSPWDQALEGSGTQGRRLIF